MPSTKVLQPTIPAKVASVVIYIAGIVAVYSWMPDGFRLLAAVAYALAGPFWIAEIFLTSIVLDGDTILIWSRFRCRTLSRAEVSKVTWAAGCGAWLELQDGTGVQLPSLGRSAQGLTNTIRAWLKAA